MNEEQPRRKPRVPLSPEELYYFIKLKKLKQVEKVERFKATFFYKIGSCINIFLAGLITYFILSILILTSWEPSHIAYYSVSRGGVKPENNQRTISEIQLQTMSGYCVVIKTDYLFEEPKKHQPIYLGKDILFNKILKVKLSYDDRAFWSINAYASLSVCFFVLCIGFLIYKINKHLSVNGLLTVFGLFSLASLYFLLI